ncbi:hypothetical protein PoB_003712500 [Plakobranchus ocellatus]|uniref:Uncharacterized protein n=1 Tax=Plakobranchus ocellatus TaxID=259542 RepID=A0AAV4AUP6_9GAST|nr:hypothetical protein PoB_003712500 [Plakobranchus ocellatus]
MCKYENKAEDSPFIRLLRIPAILNPKKFRPEICKPRNPSVADVYLCGDVGGAGVSANRLETFAGFSDTGSDTTMNAKPDFASRKHALTYS